MIKVVRFFFGERTRPAFAWISIIWLTSAASIIGSQSVKLEATTNVQASCGDNVTLTCNASFSQKPNIKLFSWVDGERTLCTHNNASSDSDVLCESKNESSHHRLSLTLINVMPVNERKYICKLHSTEGPKSNTTFLTVQNCFERSEQFINNSYAKCWFRGVYPRGSIHWFQGDDNLTDHASTQQEKDQHGRYTVWSQVKVEKGNMNRDYNCSLWVDDDRKYVSSQMLIMPQKLSSTGIMVKLQWIYMLLEIMMLKSVL